jgi:hypothetical protein
LSEERTGKHLHRSQKQSCKGHRLAHRKFEGDQALRHHLWLLDDCIGDALECLRKNCRVLAKNGKSKIITMSSAYTCCDTATNCLKQTTDYIQKYLIHNNNTNCYNLTMDFIQKGVIDRRLIG